MDGNDNLPYDTVHRSTAQRDGLAVHLGFLRGTWRWLESLGLGKSMFSIQSLRNAFCSDSGEHSSRDPQSYNLNSDLFDKYLVRRTEQIQLFSPTKKALVNAYML